MESYRYLLDVALILLSTKVFGLLTRRIVILYRNRNSWIISRKSALSY